LKFALGARVAGGMHSDVIAFAQSFDRGIEALFDSVASCARAGAWGAEATAGHSVNVRGPLMALRVYLGG